MILMYVILALTIFSMVTSAYLLADTFKLPARWMPVIWNLTFLIAFVYFCVLLFFTYKIYCYWTRFIRERRDEPLVMYDGMSHKTHLDFDKLIIEYLTKMADLKHPERIEVRWRHVTFRCNEPRFTGGADCLSVKPVTVFSKDYVNKSNQEVIEPVNVNKTLTSSIYISLWRSFACQNQMLLNLNGLKAASGRCLPEGFTESLSEQMGLTREASCPKTFTIHKEVTMQPMTKTTVTVEVEEESYEGTFEMLVTIDGDVLVRDERRNWWRAHNVLRRLRFYIGPHLLSVDSNDELDFHVQGWCKYTLYYNASMRIQDEPLQKKRNAPKC